MDRIREFFELERFELREVIYESFLRKFDGDFEFVRIKERFELRRLELERVNWNVVQIITILRIVLYRSLISTTYFFGFMKVSLVEEFE